MLTKSELFQNQYMKNIPTIKNRFATTKWEKFCTVFEYFMEWMALAIVLTAVILGTVSIK